MSTLSAAAPDGPELSDAPDRAGAIDPTKRVDVAGAIVENSDARAGSRAGLPYRHQRAAALRAVTRSEWIKLRTLRSTVWLFVLTAAIGFAVAWATAVLVTDEVLLTAEVSTYSAVFTALLASIAGILFITSEVQHGTLAAAFAAHPTRSVVVEAKALVAVTFGLVLGAVGVAGGLAGAALGGLEDGATSAVATHTAWVLVFTGTSALLGLGVGMIVPHSTAAISGLLAWWLVFENLLLVFLPERIARFLPYVAGGGLLDIDTAWEFDSLARIQAALVFGAYAAAALVVGTVLLHRRDIH